MTTLEGQLKANHKPLLLLARPRSSSDLQTLPDLLNKVRTATLQIGSASALEHPLTSMLKSRNYIGIDDVMGDVARLRDMGLPYEDKVRRERERVM